MSLRHAFFLLLLTPACHSSVPPILTDNATKGAEYDYVVVEPGAVERVEAAVERDDIVTRYYDDGGVAYVLSGDAASRLARQGHSVAPLDHATLRVRIRRLGDDGDGTAINAEVDRAEGADVHFTGEDIGSAFTELQAYAADPWVTLQTQHGDLLRKVTPEQPANSFEKGFVVELSVELWGGNPNDPETAAKLYALRRESAYTKTVWQK